MKRATCYAVAMASLFLAIGPSGQVQSQSSLSYEFFRDKVQPVFLAKREGHARCVVCHSRKNFELVQRVVQPGYIDSPLIKHPLAEEAGGDAHHGGAQQFTSKEDPA